MVSFKCVNTPFFTPKMAKGYKKVTNTSKNRINKPYHSSPSVNLFSLENAEKLVYTGFF